MALAARKTRDMPQYPAPEQIGGGVDGAQVAAQWVPLCWPPQGMNCTDPVASITMSQPRWAFNVVPEPGRWKTRYGTAYVGDGVGYVAESSTTIVYARQVIDASGSEWLIRWTTTGVEIIDGGAWVACTGPALGMNKYGKVAMTGWANLLIFSDGVTGTYALDMNARTYTLITDAPAAGDLATFNLRIIASIPNTSRVQWCVARDYTDWTSTNLGAGYEDLLSAPGGSVDTQTAVLPVSDEIAYLVRSNSIWQMEPTRNLDAPFAFSRVVATLGSRWPATCVTIPGGIAFMSDEGVYLFRGGQVEDLTAPIRSMFAGVPQTALRSACMCYDQHAENLRLSGDFTVETGTPITVSSNLTLRWHFRIGGGWTADYFRENQKVRAVSSTLNYRRRLTIGELTGTIGDLEGVVGDLGVSGTQSGFLAVLYDEAFATNWVARDAPDYGSGYVLDTRGNGLSSGPVPVLISGAGVPGGGMQGTVGRILMTVRAAGYSGGFFILATWVNTDEYGNYYPVGTFMPNLATLLRDAPLTIDIARNGFRPRIALNMQSTHALEITDLRVRYTPGSAVGWR